MFMRLALKVNILYRNAGVVYWKNSGLRSASGTTCGSIARIFRKGNGTFANRGACILRVTFDSQAVYWKNGTAVPLTEPDPSAVPSKVFNC